MPSDHPKIQIPIPITIPAITQIPNQRIRSAVCFSYLSFPLGRMSYVQQFGSPFHWNPQELEILEQ